MSTYVISDIHGEYDAFRKILDKIKFTDDDVLYILGDVFDRGDMPISTLLYIMDNPNMHMIYGNHELMALYCLDILLEENQKKLLNMLKTEKLMALQEWQMNGGTTTINELKKYDKIYRKKVYNYLLKLKLYYEIKVNDKKYVLVHAGLSNFKKDRKLNKYNADEIVWDRADYNKQYYKDKYIITGHTPTRTIEGNNNKDKIYQCKNNIAIDCGCTYGGCLSCLRLDDMKEFYVKI